MVLDSVLDATVRGAGVISEENNPANITWQNGVGDKAEMGGRSGVAAGLRRANLAVVNGKVAMFSALVPAWHSLGKVITQAATTAEALELASLSDWNLTKVQQYADWNGVKIDTDSYAVVRGDNGEYLGTVGKGYKVVSNEECFAIMDDIIGAGGARYETAGALGKGETAWMLAQMPDRFEAAPGDEVVPYLLCSTGHDGTAAIRIFPTADRVVCQNTLRLAKLGGRNKGICIRHTGNIDARVANAKHVLGLARKQVTAYKERSTALAGVQLAPQEYFKAVLDDVLAVTVADVAFTEANLKNRSILDAILAIGDVEAQNTEFDRVERALKRRKELLDDMLERYESPRNNGMKAIAGTAWAAVNAATENMDHSKLWSANGDKERRFTRALMGAGDDAKQTAYVTAMQFAGLAT